MPAAHAAGTFVFRVNLPGLSKANVLFSTPRRYHSQRVQAVPDISAPPATAPTLPYRAAVTGLAAASLIALMLALPLGAAGYVTEAFAGASLLFLYTWRRPADWLAAAVVAAILAAIYAVSHAAVTPWIGWEIAFPASLYGLAGIIVLLYRATAASPEDRVPLLDTLRNTALIPALCLVSIVAVWLDIRFTPRTWDWSLYRFDQTFGVQPSFALAKIYWPNPPLRFIAGLIYSSLPVNMCLMCAVWIRRKPRTVPDVRLAFVLMGVGGFLLYQLCPAAGPLYLAGRAFPYHPPAISDALKAIHINGVPRNAMPSLHVASCLLIVFNSWRCSRPLRIYALLCLILTAFATLATGEHYLIDLIVAVPLGLAVQLAASKKLRPAIVLLAIVISWLIALRTGLFTSLPQPFFSWLAVAATLSISAIVGRRLSASQRNRGADLRMAADF